MTSLIELFQRARTASLAVASAEDSTVTALLEALAGEIDSSHDFLLGENMKDLELADPASPMYDRLKLTGGRLDEIADGIRKVNRLPSPLGRVLSHDVRPNGLVVERVSVPFGVVGIVYEARPNVTFDVVALCLKSGNACVLKGSRNTDNSNKAIVCLIHRVLERYGLPSAAVTLLPPTHEAVDGMLHADKYIDVIIPRGGAGLISHVRQNATVPVIETGAGTCHIYFDRWGDTAKGAAIIRNAKTRRVSVCNALDCLIINSQRLADLPALCAPMASDNVIIDADGPAFDALQGHYPESLLRHAAPECYGKEFLDYEMSIATVGTLEEALEHIRRYGSGHSEAIVTEDDASARAFLSKVDAACVYHNAPTSFSDGMQLGLGAEIGISTQKLHARGPMGLEELTTYKWIIRGDGQVRPV